MTAKKTEIERAEAAAKKTYELLKKDMYNVIFQRVATAQSNRLSHIKGMVEMKTDDFVQLFSDLVDMAVANAEPGQEEAAKQQAWNVRTNAQNIVGALKHSKKQLEDLGWTEETGYIQSSKMAQKALLAAGKTWKGEEKPEAANEAQAAPRAGIRTELVLEVRAKDKKQIEKAAKLVESAELDWAEVVAWIQEQAELRKQKAG